RGAGADRARDPAYLEDGAGGPVRQGQPVLDPVELRATHPAGAVPRHPLPRRLVETARPPLRAMGQALDGAFARRPLGRTTAQGAGRRAHGIAWHDARAFSTHRAIIGETEVPRLSLRAKRYSQC